MRAILAISIFVCGCSTPGTAVFNTADEVWFSEHSGYSNNIYYCIANKDRAGKPRPVCVRPLKAASEASAKD